MIESLPEVSQFALTRFEQPLGCAAQVLGPAVAAGCPVVIRPALSTPSAALALGEMLVDAGWPAEAISVLPCDDAVAAALVADPRFATLALSPTTPPAAWVAAKLRKRHVLLACAPPVALLVEDDADLDRAVATLVRGAYAHGGQTRGWAQRVLVHEAVWDEVCARFAAAAAAVPRGDPAREDVVCGPLIDGRGLARAEAWIKAAEQLGGRRLVGGHREGTVLAPAAIAAEAPYYELLEGAPYGPVAVLEPYRSLDAGIDRVNRQSRPGDTALFTRCVTKVWRAFERLDGGSLVHDTHPDLAAREPHAVRGTIDELLSPRTLVMAGPEMAH
ncbi:MAG: aldehyde dehydrogenase family protein [Myxococcota bacterium]